MAVQVKHVLYRSARAAGLFTLARKGTRDRIRILGYHGFASDDEARFRPKTFISGPTFRTRLQFLNDAGYRVVSLNEAVQALNEGRVEPDMVAITIDDGYASTLSVAAPLLHEFGFPATVYLTTYHMERQTPVFDMVVAYLLWRTTRARATLPLPDLPEVMLTNAADKVAAADRLIEYGHTLDGEERRVSLSRQVGVAIGVDYDAVVAGQSFRLMDFNEARALRHYGLSVGLHTHRHRFPPGAPDQCRLEIDHNRSLLEREVGGPLVHFCYPSGVYARQQFDVLSESGILSATTCDTGLVRLGDEPYGLKRFLDGEMVSSIEFEAELSGFAELLRQSLGVRRSPASY